MAKLGTSQNGWPVYDDTSHYVRTTAAGVGWWSANADVATVLDDFTEWFHREIEPLDLKVTESPGYDDWSYAVRPVRGQTTGYSNHGSGTARDYNATRHPRGVKGTFTEGQRAKLAARRAQYVDPQTGRSVIRLGEFYSSTVDGMHIEINEPPAAVARVAARIRAEREDDDVKLTDDVKYTTTAKARLKRDADDFGFVVQWPPAVRLARDEIERLRRETAAQFGALNATVAALAGAIKAGGSLTAAQAQAAAEAGARAALAELADVLDGDEEDDPAAPSGSR